MSGRRGYTFAIVLTLLLMLAPSAAGEQLSKHYTFAAPVITSSEIDGYSFQRLVLPTAPSSGHPGQPSLPVRPVSLLLPYGCKLEHIEIMTGEPEVLTEGCLVEPVAQPMKLSSSPEGFPPVMLDSSVYESARPFPAALYELVGIQRFRGYNIALINLHPVTYIPAAGRVEWLRRMEVIVHLSSSAVPTATFRGTASDAAAVSARVDNPEVAATYPTMTAESRDEIDLLIITLPSLVAAFQPLKDYHDTTGIATAIRTVYGDISGSQPDDVRTYILDCYLTEGVEYVLIGADDNLIPAKDLFVQGWETIEYNMPTDHFFGCLDGTYNFDGDAFSGEPTDGDGGGDVDLIAEVYVGRAPVDNSADVARFVNKTIQYLTSSVPYLDRVLLTGEYLAYGGLKSYGGYALDELVNGSTDNGYSTIGIPGDLYDIELLYDRDWPGNYWQPIEVVNRINDGRHLITHLWHSNYEYSLKLYTTDLAQLTNTDLFFLHNMGCHSGWFDERDCWAEQLVVKMDGGAFASIANARYGWVEGWLDTHRADGPSLRFCREFWDAVFNPAEDKPQLGRAHQDSKEDNLWRINVGANRWVCYESNLLGDPSVSIRRPRSLQFGFPSGLPTTVLPGETVEIEVEVSGVYGGQPVPGSGSIHSRVNHGILVSVPMTETTPGRYVASLPVLECGDSLSYYFSAEEAEYGSLFDITPEQPHLLAPADSAIVFFADDFEDGPIWYTSGGLWQRGIPTGQGGEHTSPDPTSGCNGPTVLGYNLDGDYENNATGWHLASPAIDCSGRRNVHLKFCRWLGVEQAPLDRAAVSISDDGSNWTTLWENTVAVADTEWIEIDLDISEQADNQPLIQLRWTMGPTDDSMTYCGWNIDDIRLISYPCPTWICGDADGNELVNISDAVFLVAYIFGGGPAPEPLEAADADCNSLVNITDAVYLIAYIFGGGPVPCDPNGDGITDC